MKKTVKRNDYERLFNNITKYNKMLVNPLNKGNIHNGLNRSYLAQRYSLLVERVYTNNGSYNKFVAPKEFIKIYGRDSVEYKEYFKQRKDFMEYLGVTKVGVGKDTITQLETKARENREAEISKDWEDKQPGGETIRKAVKDWSSEDWDIANELMRSGLDSNSAISLAYNIINEDLDGVEKVIDSIETDKNGMKFTEEEKTKYFNWIRLQKFGDIIW